VSLINVQELNSEERDYLFELMADTTDPDLLVIEELIDPWAGVDFNFSWPSFLPVLEA
jgi:hypothetical protein